MNRLLPLVLSTVAALGTLSLPAVHAAAPTRPTIEQLAAFPQFSGFSLSPDGKHIAALRGRDEERVIAVWKTDALDKGPTLIGAQSMKIQSVSFIKNDMLAVTLWQPYDLRTDRVSKLFISKLMLTDLEGKQWKEPLPQPRAKSRDEQLIQALSNPTILSRLPGDPDHILVVNNIGNSAGDVYKVNVRTFAAERVQMTEQNVAGYMLDTNSNLRARTQVKVESKGAYIAAEIKNLETGAWEEHFRSYVKDRNVTEIVGFSSDPNIAFILTNEGRDKSVIYEYDIAARSKRELLFEHKLFNASGVETAQDRNSGGDSGKIIGFSYQGPRGYDVEWTSPELRALDAGISKALNIQERNVKMVDPATGKSVTVPYASDKNYSIVRSTPDRSVMLIVLHGSSVPPEYYLFRNGSLTLLAKSYPDIDGKALGTTELVYYKARDGLDIPAFLTKPNAELCGAGPWPAVVHPHGGPWARDSMSFDSSMWVPLMASRCMAVLRPQFRGSEGWGRKLWMAGDNEWGQKMQDDKDDGAKWMIDNKIAVPGRIAMFGYSYGGYSAFAASVRPNGLYKCAIAGAGVSDIRRIWARFYTNPFFRQSQEHTVTGLSPLDKAGEMKIPLMVFHGDRDRTVPLEQSEWFVAAAKKSGVPVEYHEIKDHAHGPSWTRKIGADQLRIIETYLLEGCGGGGL